MKTHMMGVGMALIGMILMPQGGQSQRRGGRVVHAEEAGYSRAMQAEGGLTGSRLDLPRVTAQELAALIPAQEESAECVEAMRAEAAGVLKRIGQSGVLIAEAAVGKTGIFSFRAEGSGVFELREMMAEGAVKGRARKLGLMERIRRL